MRHFLRVTEKGNEGCMHHITIFVERVILLNVKDEFTILKSKIWPNILIFLILEKKTPLRSIHTHPIRVRYYRQYNYSLAVVMH